MNVQKFVLRICAKQWELGYDELMINFNVPSLQNRRLYHNCALCIRLYIISFFPPTRLFLYLTPIVTMPTHLSSHLHEPIHSFIHMSPVLFPHGTHCLVTLLMIFCLYISWGPHFILCYLQLIHVFNFHCPFYTGKHAHHNMHFVC